MKKGLFLFLVVLMVAGLACGRTDDEPKTPSKPHWDEPRKPEPPKAGEKQFGSLREFCERLPEKEGRWLSGPPGWHIHFRDAYEASKREDKPMLILQTGSDWCGFCIKLRKALFDKMDFHTFARKNLVLLYLDSPSKKKQPHEQDRHNGMVSKHFAFSGGFPAVRVISPNGTLLGEKVGFNGDAKEYLEDLQSMVRSYRDEKQDAPTPPKPSEDK